MPFLIIIFILGILFGWIVNDLHNDMFFEYLMYGEGAGKERASPSDTIKESDIHLLKDKIIIYTTDLPNLTWASYTDTNSMDPVLDELTHGFEYRPSNISGTVQVGDIISYTKPKLGFIIHRVIETGWDGFGWYAIVKGDNLRHIDPYKIRENDVQGILFALVY